MLEGIGPFTLIDSDPSQLEKSILINFEFLSIDAESNFKKYSRGEIDNLGEPYDYGSIMHYGPTYFSRDGLLPTIVKLRPGGPRMGQREAMTSNDINQLNKLYSCIKYISE